MNNPLRKNTRQSGWAMTFPTEPGGSIAKNILQALIIEIKQLQDPWLKLSKEKQDFIIDRLRNCVEINIQKPIRLVA
jgi:hypothetical protein